MGVAPTIWTRRDARSRTNTVSYVTNPRHVHYLEQLDRTLKPNWSGPEDTARTPLPLLSVSTGRKGECTQWRLARISQYRGTRIQMQGPLALSALTARGIQLKPHKAVAVVQQLIYSNGRVELTQPFGPPTLDTVVICVDGRVFSRASAVAPAISEIGRLFEALLPQGSVAVPGGLRYTIARARSGCAAV